MRDTKADELTTTNIWGNRATSAISTGRVSMIEFIDTRYRAGQMRMISQNTACISSQSNTLSTARWRRSV
jgi:hypothetical protein